MATFSSLMKQLKEGRNKLIDIPEVPPVVKYLRDIFKIDMNEYITEEHIKELTPSHKVKIDIKIPCNIYISSIQLCLIMFNDFSFGSYLCAAMKTDGLYISNLHKHIPIVTKETYIPAAKTIDNSCKKPYSHSFNFGDDNSDNENDSNEEYRLLADKFADSYINRDANIVSSNGYELVKEDLWIIHFVTNFKLINDLIKKNIDTHLTYIKNIMRSELTQLSANVDIPPAPLEMDDDKPTIISIAKELNLHIDYLTETIEYVFHFAIPIGFPKTEYNSILPDIPEIKSVKVPKDRRDVSKEDLAPLVRNRRKELASHIDDMENINDVDIDEMLMVHDNSNTFDDINDNLCQVTEIDDFRQCKGEFIVIHCVPLA